MTCCLNVIIVTHLSAKTVPGVLDALRRHGDIELTGVVVVDCGSGREQWMDAHHLAGMTFLSSEKNLGFTGGNNLAWERVREREGFVLFLNPDVIVPAGLPMRLLKFAGSEGAEFGALSVRLDQWDFSSNRQMPGIDSTGVFPRFRGWADRREGSPPEGDYVEEVPAICGAFLFGRIDVFRSVERSPGELWDNRYFAYKEDIELSLRMRRAGHKLGIWHGATAYHGRGWNADRRRVSRFARLLSARNEIRLDAEYMPHRLPISLSKWLAVKFFNL